MAKEAAQGPDRELLDKYITTIDLSQLGQQVLICKTGPMYESKHRRLTVQLCQVEQDFSIKEGELSQGGRQLLTASRVWPTIKRIILKEKAAKVLLGTAPMGAQARTIQSCLSKME